jgi:hypothetical protein
MVTLLLPDSVSENNLVLDSYCIARGLEQAVVINTLNVNAWVWPSLRVHMYNNIIIIIVIINFIIENCVL